MTTIYTSTTENLDLLDTYFAKRVKAVCKADPRYTSLDAVEKHLRLFFDGWFVYRGGAHVSLHLQSGGPRYLLVTERQQPAEAVNDAFARVAAYIATLPREEKLYASSYAHNVDEHGVDDAAAYMVDRNFGVGRQRRTEIRRAVLAARLDPTTIPDEPLVIPVDVDIRAEEEFAAQNAPQTSQEAAGEANAPAPDVRPAVVATLGYGSYCENRDSYDFKANEAFRARLQQFADAVNSENAKNLDTVARAAQAVFRGWHIEREPGLVILARSKRHSPAIVFAQALTAAEAGVEAGGVQDIWVNQGLREGIVLATIGRRYLVEYTMPAGTTGLQVFTVGAQGSKTVSYGSCPAYWLQAIVDAGQEWIGNGQGRRVLGGVKAALAAKKGGR